MRQRAQVLESILELLTEIHENLQEENLSSPTPRGVQGPGIFAGCLRGSLLEEKRRGDNIDGPGCWEFGISGAEHSKGGMDAGGR